MKKKVVLFLAHKFLRLFYDEKWLSGKWFDKYRGGYLWALKSIPHRILHPNRPWPYSSKATILTAENLIIAPSSLNNLQGDKYFQNRRNKIIIGENCYIARYVGFITEQHDIYNLDEHVTGKDIVIGDDCWIGMNTVIMPGVVLGNHTVVGANSVVTKSFSEGYIIIAGSPAKIIKRLNKNDFMK